MKKIIFLILAAALALSLAACGGESSATSKNNQNVISDDNSPSKEAKSEVDMNPSAHAGTRSDPYNLGDEITVLTKNRYSDYTVKYTIILTELWGKDKVSSEYPDYLIDDRILIRGTITVDCNETDDEIEFDLYPTFVTASLNEESADFQTYKAGELNNLLRTVYSGGSYDIIAFGSDDGIGSLDVSFLKIGYTNNKGESANLWISLPPVQDSEPINREPTAMDAPEIQSDLTSEELDILLLEQPMYVESTEYVVQDERYKALYPDMLQAIIRNNSGTDVKNAILAFVAWDSNGFPIKIYSSGVDIHGGYVREVNYGDINLTNGSSYGSDNGFGIDSDKSKISIFKAIVVSYEDFSGNTWTNPYYDTWVNKYSDKKLN